MQLQNFINVMCRRIENLSRKRDFAPLANIANEKLKTAKFFKGMAFHLGKMGKEDLWVAEVSRALADREKVAFGELNLALTRGSLSEQVIILGAQTSELCAIRSLLG